MFNIGDIVTIHDVEQQFDGLDARVTDYDHDLGQVQVDIFDQCMRAIIQSLNLTTMNWSWHNASARYVTWRMSLKCRAVVYR